MPIAIIFRTPSSTSGAVAVIRDFQETILTRAQRGARCHWALFTGAINACLAGDTTTGKAIVRDLVTATVGFADLAEALNKPRKSPHRLLAPRGNPSTETSALLSAPCSRRRASNCA